MRSKGIHIDRQKRSFPVFLNIQQTLRCRFCFRDSTDKSDDVFVWQRLQIMRISFDCTSRLCDESSGFGFPSVGAHSFWGLSLRARFVIKTTENEEEMRKTATHPPTASAIKNKERKLMKNRLIGVRRRHGANGIRGSDFLRVPSDDDEPFHARSPACLVINWRYAPMRRRRAGDKKT